ncbi:hypothetical protein PTKIN_Ptkin01aG0152000 [Pterospermum kingtungense]
MKKQYHAILEMLSIGSGFGWNDVEKCSIFGKDLAIRERTKTSFDAVHEFDKEHYDNVDGEDFVDVRNADFDGTGKFHLVPQGVNKFLAYLRRETKVLDKLKEFPIALEKIKVFTCAKLVNVGAHIGKEEWKVEYFFTLPEKSRLEFVKFQLEEIAPTTYHPIFEKFL